MLETLQNHYRVPVWRPDLGQCYPDWETLFLVSYYGKGCHFDLENQFGLLLSSQHTKRQSTLARQLRDERLCLMDLFLLIHSYGIRISNPYSPSTVFTSLGGKGNLTGDVGPDEWYDFFAWFLHHGRRVTGKVPMWQAHSVLPSAGVAYAKGKSADNPWYSIKQDLLQGQTSRGNVPYTYCNTHCNPQRGGQYKPSLIPVDVEKEDMRVIVLAHDGVTVTRRGINVSEVMGICVTVTVMEVRVTVTVIRIRAHAVVVVVVVGTDINVLVSMVVGKTVDAMGLISVIIGEDQMGRVVKAPAVAGVVTVSVVLGLNLILRDRMDVIFLATKNRQVTVATLAAKIE